MVNPIHFKETYELGRNYCKVKSRARISLKEFFYYKDLFSWDDHKKKITFTSERLIPRPPRGKPRVMLLFSNPHPRSVHMGMFHSYKLPNAFWSKLQEAKWLTLPTEDPKVDQLREIFLQVTYDSPFEFILYCIMLSPLDTRNSSPKFLVNFFMKRFSRSK